MNNLKQNTGILSSVLIQRTKIIKTRFNINSWEAVRTNCICHASNAF